MQFDVKTAEGKVNTGSIAFARLSEGAGLRWFYELICPAEKRVPTFGQIDAGVRMNPVAFDQAMKDARYFTFANVIRSLLYLPIAVGLVDYPNVTSMVVLAILILFHGVCILTERYRFGLLDLLRAKNALDPEIKQALPAVIHPYRGYFSPKSWETPEFYRRLGFERLRKIVKRFVRFGEGGEPRNGFKRHELLELEQDTRSAERIHLLAGMTMLPFALGFAKAEAHDFAYYAFGILIFDVLLAITQRYHRVRAWSALRWERLR